MKPVRILASLLLLICACIAQGKEEEAPDRLKSARFKYELKREQLLTRLNEDYVKHLTQLQKSLTKEGDLDGALLARNEIEGVKAGGNAGGEAAAPLKAMAGKWVWSSGAISEFTETGKDPKGVRNMWVLDVKERRIHIRGNIKLQYEIILSEDGKSFTATEIYSGVKSTGKKVSK